MKNFILTISALLIITGTAFASHYYGLDGKEISSITYQKDGGGPTVTVTPPTTC